MLNPPTIKQWSAFLFSDQPDLTREEKKETDEKRETEDDETSTSRGNITFQETFEMITRSEVKSWQMSITEMIGRKRKQ